MIIFLRIAIFSLIAVCLIGCGSTSNVTGVECPTFASYRTDAANDYVRYRKHSRFMSKIRKRPVYIGGNPNTGIKRQKVKTTLRPYGNKPWY